MRSCFIPTICFKNAAYYNRAEQKVFATADVVKPPLVQQNDCGLYLYDLLKLEVEQRNPSSSNPQDGPKERKKSKNASQFQQVDGSRNVNFREELMKSNATQLDYLMYEMDLNFAHQLFKNIEQHELEDILERILPGTITKKYVESTPQSTPARGSERTPATESISGIVFREDHDGIAKSSRNLKRNIEGLKLMRKFFKEDLDLNIEEIFSKTDAPYSSFAPNKPTRLDDETPITLLFSVLTRQGAPRDQEGASIDQEYLSFSVFLHKYPTYEKKLLALVMDSLSKTTTLPTVVVESRQADEPEPVRTETDAQPYIAAAQSNEVCPLTTVRIKYEEVHQFHIPGKVKEYILIRDESLLQLRLNYLLLLTEPELVNIIESSNMRDQLTNELRKIKLKNPRAADALVAGSTQELQDTINRFVNVLSTLTKNQGGPNSLHEYHWFEWIIQELTPCIPRQNRQSQAASSCFPPPPHQPTFNSTRATSD